MIYSHTQWKEVKPFIDGLLQKWRNELEGAEDARKVAVLQGKIAAIKTIYDKQAKDS